MYNIPPQRPIIDQICFSIQGDFVSIEQSLIDVFGSGIRTSRGTHFKDANVFMSYPNKWGWFRINFPGTEGHLHCIGLALSKHVSTSSKKRTKGLKSLELSFDFPFPNVDYHEVEANLKKLAFRLFSLRGNRNHFHTYSGKEFKTCSDGAINGLVTFYVHAINKEQQKKGKVVPAKNIATKTKVYCKKIDGIWNIRMEITLYSTALKYHFPFLPREYERILKLCKSITLNEFLVFYTIDYDKFRTDANRIAEKNKKVNPKLNILLANSKNKPAIEQIRGMKKIADYICSSHLKNNVKRYCRVISFEEAMMLPIDGV